MQLDKLIVKDFGSFADAEYSFKDGLWLVEGINEDKDGSSNGSGKSFFFSDAITWLLFDQTCRGIRYDTVIRKGCKDTFVTGLFEDTEITRTKSVGKGSVITVNGKKKSQTEIEQLVGMDFITFTSSVIHAQSFIGFADLGETEQKSILTKLMDLEKWDYYKTLVDAESQIIKKAIYELNHRINFSLARFDELKSKDFTKDKEAFEDEKNLKLLSNSQSISDCKDKIKEIHSEISLIKTEDITLLEKTLEAMLSSIILLEQEQSNGRLEEKELYSKLSTIKNNISRINQDIQNIRNLTGICPTCFTEITDHNKLKCIKELEKQYNKLGKEYVDFVKPYNKLVPKNNSRDDGLKEEREKLREIENILSKQKYLLNKKELLESTRKQQFGLLEKLQDERKEISKSKFPGYVLEDEIQKEVKILVSSVSSDIKEANLHENILRYYEFWGMGFSNKGIKSYIFDQIIPELTIRTNKYISKLTNLDITINFSTQRENKSGEIAEKFTIILADKQGERPYNAWSGGEKKRISVAIDLALSDIVGLKSSNFWNFIVFDEVSDGLDEEGKNMMMYLLEDIMKERNRVIIISHDPTMNGVIDNRIIVRKTNGVSRIEES